VSTALLAGVDVSPLEVTRAGTSRYITGLLGGFAAADGLQILRYRF
jgi:hypothetical protein